MSYKKQTTAAAYLLMALVPYSRQNLQLVFSPSRFFDDLERTSGLSRTTLQQSFARLKKQKYITDDKIPNLTAKGRRYVQPFVATRFQGASRLMVIFDVPQDFNEQRRQFRNLLRQLGFAQIQRSVWVSPYDHTQVIKEAVKEFGLVDWVEMFEVSKIE